MELAPLPPAGLQPEPEPEPVAAVAAQQVWPVAFGSVTMAGRMRIMEDTVSLHPNLCTWAADGSPMHFFAVFDGHGGPHVSALCRERMHELVAEELEREGAAFLRRRQASSDAARSVAAFLGGPPAAEPWSEKAEEERAWRAALMRSFRRVDAMAPLACACGRVTHPACGCPLSVTGAAVRSNGIVGSTAVVAILVRGRLIVANCGDSRAVLCRGLEGTPPVPLSFDHKGGGSGRWCSTDIKAAMQWQSRGYSPTFGAVAVRRAPSLSPGGYVAATAGDSEGRGHVSVDAGARVETPVVAGRWGPWQSSKPQQSPLAVACAAGPAGEEGGGGRRRHLPCCRCSGRRENPWEGR
ncbi:unnamed protein product [Miscanthus lutarioriparius]|uniref:protein-serine/threonine phosphatase n=1 Tax=Miscanthus lutarioriparius TaxID=422564 RepID=A0A811R303_9POAL|nr:unnamed protein product [Miscanthus lutarioriparius]